MFLLFLLVTGNYLAKNILDSFERILYLFFAERLVRDARRRLLADNLFHEQINKILI